VVNLFTTQKGTKLAVLARPRFIHDTKLILCAEAATFSLLQ